MDTEKYKSLVFDCDGVVLNSNKIKTQAFYEAAKHLGEDNAQSLVDYHVQNGGISRYVKMEYFITQILKQPFEEAFHRDLLERFAKAVIDGMMRCEVAEGLEELKARTPNANWMIVSGGDQAELREVFAARGLDRLFDGGIYGSPNTKDEILARELATQNISSPALFLGDSKYDYRASSQAGLDFVFISDWTEVKDWQSFIKSEAIVVRKSLSSLIS